MSSSDTDSDLLNSDSEQEWSDLESSGSDVDDQNTVDRALMERCDNVEMTHGSYDDIDRGPLEKPAPFRPENPPGVKGLVTDGKWTRRSFDQFTSAGSFFALFFTETMLNIICMWTNKYAERKGPTIPSMFYNWQPLTVTELKKFIALLMYLSIVRLPCLHLYWCTSSLFSGLWAKRFMSRFRFLQIQSFLKCSDPDGEAVGDKLAKVRCLEEFIKQKAMKFWQPNEQISIDERMVPNKGRSSFRQYIKDKPTKWGMKFWVLADSVTGYTFNFDIYTGRGGGDSNSKNGLAFDVVMKLCKPLFDQGYKLYVDNFYSSVALFEELIKRKIFACGTINLNRKNVPTHFKNVKIFKKSGRGAMRWVRRGICYFYNGLIIKQFLSSLAFTPITTLYFVKGEVK